MPKQVDISGQTFGRLTAIEIAGRKYKTTLWRCRCSCGNETIVFVAYLRSGHTKSCGCLRGEITSQRNYTHGERQTRLYKIWAGMKQRCTNPKIAFFHRYGGRGIKVCEDWNVFEPFRDWAIANGYRNDLSIDRINNDGNYEPSNCRWITQSSQSRNTSQTRAVIRSDGKRFEIMADAAHETGCTSIDIVSVCRGKQKTASGYGWRYAV
jgi:hypothetical protein